MIVSHKCIPIKDYDFVVDSLDKVIRTLDFNQKDSDKLIREIQDILSSAANIGTWEEDELEVW